MTQSSESQAVQVVEAPVERPDTHEHPFEFRGSAGEYFRIWIVNILLSVVTLGVYSAWAKVRTQRYMAASTSIAGAPFAYLASPIAILKGRSLVAAYFVLYGASSFVSGYLELAFGMGLLLAIPWAIVRSLAFRAHNTAWRNLRFGFRAGYGPALGAYLGYPILGVVTLGVLYPDAVFRQRRLLVDNARYGTTAFELSSSRRDFYRLFGRLLAASLVVGAIVGVGFSVGGSEAVLAVGLLALPFYLLLVAMATSGIANLTYDGVRIGRHRLRSRIPALGLTALYATNTLAVLLSAGLLIPWARIRSLRFRFANMGFEASGSLDDFVASQDGDVGGLGSELGDSLGFDLGL